MKNLVAIQSAVSAFILMIFGIACAVTGSWKVAAIVAIIVTGGAVRGGVAFVLTAHAFAALLAAISAFALAYTFAASTPSVASYIAVIIGYGFGLVAYFVATDLEEGVGEGYVLGALFIQIAVIYGIVSFFGLSVTMLTTVVNVVGLVVVGVVFLFDPTNQDGSYKT